MDIDTRWRTVSPAPDPSSVAGRRLYDEREPIFDQGLAFDLETLIDRRRVIQLMGRAGAVAGLFTVAACVPGAATGTTDPTQGDAEVSCEVIPEEAAGPFPGDGTNGPDVLSQSGVVRSDIRSSFGAMSGTADGIPLTINLAIQDTANDCAPLAGAAAYLWHCDRDGRYSLYSQGVTDQNYLRGVQEADADGRLTFTSIFPGCYSGRWPHIHFEVYRSLAEATDAANKVATSQIALPAADSGAVYATSGYEESVTNLAEVSLESDNVFREDGGVRQLGSMTGSPESGLTVELTVPVDAG